MNSTDTFVSIHPGRRSGAPTIGNTRLPVSSVVGHVGAGDSVDEVASEYEITRGQVLAACWFVAVYGIEDVGMRGGIEGAPYVRWRGPRPGWRKVWDQWARDNHTAMWYGRWDDVPDPPTVSLPPQHAQRRYAGRKR